MTTNVKPANDPAVAVDNRFAGHESAELMLDLRRMVLSHMDLPVKPMPEPTTQVRQQPLSTPNAALSESEIRKELRRISHLFTLPDHIIKITNLLNSHQVTAEQLSREIGKDPALTVEILRTVNSGFYGFEQKIASINHAIVMMGFNAIHALTLSISVVNMRSLKPLWDHSIATAHACSLLARRAHVPRAEEISTIGLLHDIGKAIEMEFLKERFEPVFRLAEDRQIPFLEAEQSVSGLTHIEIGQWLLDLWKLPPDVIEPVGQHSELKPESPHIVRASIVHTANVLVRAAGIHATGDNRVPPLNPFALDCLGLKAADLDVTLERLLKSPDNSDSR